MTLIWQLFRQSVGPETFADSGAEVDLGLASRAGPYSRGALSQRAAADVRKYRHLDLAHAAA